METVSFVSPRPSLFPEVKLNASIIIFQLNILKGTEKGSHRGTFRAEHSKRNDEHPCVFLYGSAPKGAVSQLTVSKQLTVSLGTVLHSYQ